MATRPHKILLIGDYSNCHASLAVGLRKLGCDVTVMKPVNYLSSDVAVVDTGRGKGKIGGLSLLLKAIFTMHEYLQGNDIVAINDPNFLQLHPSRLKPLFKRLKKENSRLFYTAMSIDVNYLRMCASKDSPLTYSEFFIDGKPSPWMLENPEGWKNWQKHRLTNYQDYVFNNIDGSVAVLYEYFKGLQHRFPDNLIAYGGIPVVTDNIEYIGPRLRGKVRIMLARDRNRIKMKGSDLLEAAAKQLVERYPLDLELKIVENVPYQIFLDELKKSDIVLDQVYSYTPATTALLGMAMGKTVFSGAEPEFYDFIGETENKPLINAERDLSRLVEDLKRVALDKSFIIENAEASRQFVEKHNKDTVVAQRFLNFWTGCF